MQNSGLTLGLRHSAALLGTFALMACSAAPTSEEGVGTTEMTQQSAATVRRPCEGLEVRDPDRCPQDEGPREGTLSYYDHRCTSATDSRTPGCVNAIQQLCKEKGFVGGISQQAHGNGIAIGCFAQGKSEELLVSFDELKKRNSACSGPGRAQTDVCTSAAQNACGARGYGGAIVQRETPFSLGVACFHTADYIGVELSELRVLHSGCNSISASQTPECVAAAQLACGKRGFGGGIPQQVGATGFGIACFNPGTYFAADVR